MRFLIRFCVLTLGSKHNHCEEWNRPCPCKCPYCNCGCHKVKWKSFWKAVLNSTIAISPCVVAYILGNINGHWLSGWSGLLAAGGMGLCGLLESFTKNY